MAGDPTEGALIVAAVKAGAVREALGHAYPRIDEVPFDSTRKRMTTVHKVNDPRPEDFSPFYDASLLGWEVVATKGAPDVILDLCTQRLRIDDRPEPMTEEARRQLLAPNHAMSKQAPRGRAVDRDERSGAPGGVAGHGESRAGRHPDGDDHWRLSGDRPRHRSGYRPASGRPPGALRGRPGGAGW